MLSPSYNEKNDKHQKEKGEIRQKQKLMLENKTTDKPKKGLNFGKAHKTEQHLANIIETRTNSNKKGYSSTYTQFYLKENYRPINMKIQMKNS